MRLSFSLFILFLLVSVSSCRRGTADVAGAEDSLFINDSGVADSVTARKTLSARKKNLPEAFYGDTIFMQTSGNQIWQDTITDQEFVAYLSVRVDTSDLIVDTVSSLKGRRIVVGYNHYYQIDFKKNNKHWFTLCFNKKTDLDTLLSATDSWLESNLNVFHDLVYNKEKNLFIVEFTICSSDNISSLYYLVFTTSGKIVYIGTSNSWGGGGADGDPFLTENGMLYVTCYEVYNFVTSSALTLSEYVSLAESRSGSIISFDLLQTHGIRNLGNNRFLVIFSRFHDEPLFNAMTLSADTVILDRFKYYGLIEEMDAILLYSEIEEITKSFLLDSEREVFIVIDRSGGKIIREFAMADLNEVEDSSGTDKLYQIDFGFYSSRHFYYSDTDTLAYISAYPKK